MHIQLQVASPCIVRAQARQNGRFPQHHLILFFPAAKPCTGAARAAVGSLTIYPDGQKIKVVGKAGLSCCLKAVHGYNNATIFVCECGSCLHILIWLCILLYTYSEGAPERRLDDHRQLVADVELGHHAHVQVPVTGPHSEHEVRCHLLHIDMTARQHRCIGTGDKNTYNHHEKKVNQGGGRRRAGLTCQCCRGT